jgi:hypothetical protein
MKALQRISIIVFILLSIYSCAKKDSNTNTSGTNPQPTVTSFSVNGVAANSPIPGAYRIGNNFVVMATDVTYNYPQIKITFPDTIDPISGPYSVVHTASGPFQCSFLLTTNTSTVTTTAPASIGTVTVTAAATPNNLASFNSILCTSTGTATTTYTVTGIIKY